MRLFSLFLIGCLSLFFIRQYCKNITSKEYSIYKLNKLTDEEVQQKKINGFDVIFYGIAKKKTGQCNLGNLHAQH